MKIKAVSGIMLILLLTSMLTLAFDIQPVSTTSTQFVSCEESLDHFNVEVGNSAAYISVPFHYQSNKYYCGPAALEMVFDYYGEDIPQTEIADVARTYPWVTYTDELRRAVHFSNLSTSFGDEMPSNITGYSARKVGYAAFENWGLTTDDLKTLVNTEEPLIVLMWWSPSKVYGHYRVVVGYNETHITMNDPWNKDLWGGTYGGANTSMAYSTFLDLWEYSGNWGLLVRPWNIELQMPGTVSKGDSFEVTANITYPCSTPFDVADYPASSCKATIELQEGLKLSLGEIIQHSLGNIVAGDSAQTSWSIHAVETGLHNVSVTVTGIVEGSVAAHETYPYYDYEDEIGGLYINSLSVINQTFRVYNLNTGLNYTTIQEAVNDPETLDGHTIFVEAGIYYENVVVNKTVSLIGEDKYNTIIDGNVTENVIEVTASNVKITGFTIQESGSLLNCGIYIGEWSSGNNVSYNIITNNSNGIRLFNSSSNIISGNNIKANEYCGISLNSSKNNRISGNDVTNNAYGLGIELYESSNNSISGNNIANNLGGIWLDESSINIISGNNITNNWSGFWLGFGIGLVGSSHNLIYHNNFVNNYEGQVVTEASVNFWDDGYPSGGNYWSDYNGTDANGDGIGDTSYIIDANNQDQYPLMGPVNAFDAGTWNNIAYCVNVASNSTVSDLYFNPDEGAFIRFNVAGPDGTTGFCRVAIPKQLLSVDRPEEWLVMVGNNLVVPGVPEDENCTYLYFTYTHSTKTVVITGTRVIPEFPSATIIALFMLLTLVLVALTKKRRTQTT